MVCSTDKALARRWADFYRLRGMNPLPSRPDAKRPMVRFAQWWDEPAPADLFDTHPTSNLQIMTGRRWRLLVIDLDGPDARDWFYGLGRPVPRTWATHSGGDGLHLWFRLPEGFASPMPKAFLWKGNGKHAAVERLCDRSLIMAPPSIHPTTGKRYRFLSQGQSPAGVPLPAFCPGWVLTLKPLQADRPAIHQAPVARPRGPVSPGRFRADDVLQAISDKIGLAESWGLRVVSRRESIKGWCVCRAIGREDREPSASISVTTGRYYDFVMCEALSLFDLGARLGAYLDWRDAVADLGRRFGVREVA